MICRAVLPRITLSALAICPALAATQGTAPEPERSPMSAPVRVHVPEAGTTVLLLPGMELPTVEVYLGDAGPFRFIVEWAGNVFAVSNRVREEAALESLGVFADGGGHEIELAAVPAVQVGDAHFEDLTAGVFPFFDETDHDGALGLNVFREIVGTLDFPAGTLHITASPLPEPAKDPSVLEYSPGPGGSPRIPIRLCDQSFQAVLDTAADTTLIMDDSFLDRLTLADELTPGPVVMTPVAGRLETRLGRLACEMRIGDVQSIEPTAMFHPMQEPEILLGGGFLQDYALTLDQARRRLRLAPSRPEGTGPGEARPDDAGAAGR